MEKKHVDLWLSQILLQASKGNIIPFVQLMMNYH